MVGEAARTKKGEMFLFKGGKKGEMWRTKNRNGGIKQWIGESNQQIARLEPNKAGITAKQTRRSQLFSEVCTEMSDPSQSHLCNRQQLKATAQKATPNSRTVPRNIRLLYKAATFRRNARQI